MILITGSAGFIGYHVARTLLEQGHKVTGIDNINDYYDPDLKMGRLDILKSYKNFTFHKSDLGSFDDLRKVIEETGTINIILHLAAQAGVRYSINNPFAYCNSNLVGHLNMLETARQLHHDGKLKHFVYASSSSVYGGNTKQPFSVDDPVDLPVSLYAATKRADELMTQTYAHLYRIPSTGLRFFTVYGPWGRPDMAYFKFTKALFEGTPIKVFNHGNMKRDFTYIDDIVTGVLAAIDAVPSEQSPYNLGNAPHRIFNLGHNKPEELNRFIRILEDMTGIEAAKEYVEMQPGDVKETYAKIDREKEILGFEPKITLEEGLKHFLDWYKGYYEIPEKISLSTAAGT